MPDDLQRCSLIRLLGVEKAKILWIEGKRANSPSFVPNLRKKGYVVAMASTGSEALSRLPDFDPDVMVVNVASMRTSGKRICQSLCDSADGVPLLVISDPQRGAAKDLCANVILVLPFTTRKLVNRIVPLLPSKGKDLFEVGAIKLDLERKRVQCEDREATLTPRLLHLLKILMEHHGEALERERLFREVWNTEYTGDTRTLDVHISWLRKAIEADPRNPQYLKTIRGVGYRLDI
jgi:DNA-binding response OmpR family regulator